MCGGLIGNQDPEHSDHVPHRFLVLNKAVLTKALSFTSIHPFINASIHSSILSSLSHLLLFARLYRRAGTPNIPPPSTAPCTRTRTPPQQRLSLSLETRKQENYLGLRPWRLGAVHPVLVLPPTRSRLSLQEELRSSK